MKPFLLGFLLIVATCRPSPASDNKSIYKTAFIMNWAYSCVEQLQHNFIRDGLPLPLARQQAGIHCSCVFDQFRLEYSQDEVMRMSNQVRLLNSHRFTRKCLGQLELDQTST